jgi:hypothetical protein
MLESYYGRILDTHHGTRHLRADCARQLRGQGRLPDISDRLETSACRVDGDLHQGVGSQAVALEF